MGGREGKESGTGCEGIKYAFEEINEMKPVLWRFSMLHRKIEHDIFKPDIKKFFLIVLKAGRDKKKRDLVPQILYSYPTT